MTPSQFPLDHLETPHLWIVMGPLHWHMHTHVRIHTRNRDEVRCQSTAPGRPVLQNKELPRKSSEQQFGGFWPGALWRGF